MIGEGWGLGGGVKRFRSPHSPHYPPLLDPPKTSLLLKSLTSISASLPVSPLIPTLMLVKFVVMVLSFPLNGMAEGLVIMGGEDLKAYARWKKGAFITPAIGVEQRETPIKH